ncbi:unnamed protein product [Heterobilharzia americana]|nr:unnamed protein product [Heterobilharzia americana]
MQSDFLTHRQHGLKKSKDKFVNSNNNNNNNGTMLMTSKRSSTKINLSNQKPVVFNKKPDSDVNQSVQGADSVKDLLSPGDMVKERWRVICKLGGGGFGEIYEAIDTKLKRVNHSSTSSSSSSSSSSTMSTGSGVIELHTNMKRHFTEYSLCFNCATNNTLNALVHSPISGQYDSTLLKLKQDIGSDSGIGGIQAFSSDTQVLQHGNRINSAGTTTSASLSSRRLLLTCNENSSNKNNQSNQEDCFIHQQSSTGNNSNGNNNNNNSSHVHKISSQDFSVSNVSTPRDSSQTGNVDKKRICQSCKCELPQDYIDKFTLNNKHETNGISTDSGISSVNEAYDYRVAIKAESNRQARQVLRMEVAVLRRLQGKSNICQLFGCGKNAKFNYMVMTLQGKNLSEIRRTLPGAIFSFGTAFRLIKQCITALQTLHDAGFLHRDVKPSNFAIQRGKSKDNSQRVQVTLLDFGLARPYTINGPGSEVRNARQIAGFRGTVRYASINAHAHQDLARKDDLWSLVYMFIEFICGQLPWRRIRDKELVGQMKMALNHKELAIKSGLPVNIVNAWITHLEQLEYKSMPDYNMLIRCLDEWLMQHEIHELDLYDWEISDPNQINNNTNNQKTGTITLYKPECKPIHSEQFSHREIRTQRFTDQMNTKDIADKCSDTKEKHKNQVGKKQDEEVKEEDDDEEEEEYVNKMNETLKPNTLLQIMRDNQLTKLKQSPLTLNNRHSSSHYNLKMTTHSSTIDNNDIKGYYDNRLLKQKNMLKDYGSLGADLPSHDGDIDNAIIIEGEYSQNKQNKLTAIHNSADCILIDDEIEDNIKDDIPIEMNVKKDNDKNNVICNTKGNKNRLNNLIGTINFLDNCQQKLSTNDFKKVEVQHNNSLLPNISTSSPIPKIRNNNHDSRDSIQVKEIMSTKDNNLLTRHQTDDNDIYKHNNRTIQKSIDYIKSTISPSIDKQEWINQELNNKQLNRFNDNQFNEITSSNIDLRMNSITDKSINHLNKYSLLDQSSPYHIHFSLGHINTNDNEQYHKFLTVPRKDHISLSTLRLNRTRQSLTSNISNSLVKINQSTEQYQSINENIENKSQTTSINYQSDKNYPIPRKKRTLYLNNNNNYYTEKVIESSQNIHLKSLDIIQNNDEKQVKITKSLYQNNFLSGSNIENYRQKLIDNKQKHTQQQQQQKSINSTRLLGPTARSVLENGRSIHQNHWSLNITGNTDGNNDNTTTTTNNNISSSNSCTNFKENKNRIKRNSLSAKTLNEKLKNNTNETLSCIINYDRSSNSQQDIKNSCINGSTINQLLRSQRLTKPYSEVSLHQETGKTSIKHNNNKAKQLSGKDSVLTSIRSTSSQPIQQKQHRKDAEGVNLHSGEKLNNSRLEDVGQKQNKHSYFPLKTTKTLLTPTNLTEKR